VSKSITISCSIPLELSIQMEEHMEIKGINRSELIKNALHLYFDHQENKKKSYNLLEEIYNNTEYIKGKLK